MIMVTTSSGRHWQSNTETVLAPFPPGGERSWGCASGIAHSLGMGRGMDWPLSPDGCWPLARARGCCFLQDAGFWDPSGSPSPGALGLCAPGAVAMPGCGAQPHGSTQNYGFFSFFAFLQQTYPSRCSGESKTVHRGLLPCQPLCTGVRAEVLLWGRDCGQEPDLGPPAQSNPLAGASNLGYWTPCHPPEPSHGASVGVPGGGAENGHSSMPCEHVVAWDGVAGDGWGKTRILQNEDKVELSSSACGGHGPHVCWHPRGRCCGLVWLLRLGHTVAWPLR